MNWQDEIPWDCLNDELIQSSVGTKVWFEGEARPYRVRARSERYLVCTKPFNLKKTVIYTVVDLQKKMRGTENLVFGFGAETDEQCENMIARLENVDNPTGLSRRNSVPLCVIRIKKRPARTG